MSYQYKLPSLGDGVSGKVTEILVKPGDSIKKEQIVIIVGTDKVDAEMPVDTDGIVEEVLVKKGDEVTEGSPVLQVKISDSTAVPTPAPAPAGDAGTPAPAANPAATATTSATTMQYEYKLPSLGDGVTGKITEILVKPGDTVKKEQIVVIVGTDKVDAEMPIDADGVVSDILVKKGDEVGEGALILRMQTSGASATPGVPTTTTPKSDKESITDTPGLSGTNIPEIKTPETNQSFTTDTPGLAGIAAGPGLKSATAETAPSAHLRISPLARKRAKELGINLSDVRPAEGASRLSYKDVVDFVKQKIDTGGGSAAAGTAAVAAKQLPNFEKFGPIERQAQSRIGVLTADNMVYAFNAIPHAWISEKADITKIEQLRQQYKDQVKAAGGNLTTTAIVTKAICTVLRKMPQFNASYDLEKREVIFKKYYNIGIAVDTPRGLLVPVLRNVDQKSLTEISVELSELSTRTRDNKNKPEDLAGGTFSLSNIGGIGGTNMISIVNWPEVAILSITAASHEPYWNGTAFEPRLMMPMTIGWDHRVINGADAARFLVELKKILEEPFLGWL